MNIGVILAGGSGQRMGSQLPKQFLKVAGKLVIEHTIDVFQNHPEINEIIVVSHASYIPEIERLCNKNSYTKIKKVLSGGSERYESSLVAIQAYDEDVNLIFHDAVRPLVNNRIILDCVTALKTYNAVDVAINATDTIIRVTDHNFIDNIPPRDKLRNGQTPQAFKLSTIKKAYEIALKDPNFKTTDDCGVVYKYLPHEPVFVVKGEIFNMKLTFKEDLFLLDKLFQLKTASIQYNAILPEANKYLPEKIVVVFVGAYGIGLDLVQICKEIGAKVYSFSRTTNGVDVSDKDSVCKALKEVFDKEGRIDFVVNTAGVLQKEPLLHMSYEDIHQSVFINYMGAIFVAKEAFPYLKLTQGSLLFYTSSSYTKGRSMYSVYSSTKAAIVNLVQALSEEWYEFGVRINCINPERTKTPMRIKNFGAEPESSLLSSNTVAIASINTMLSSMTGEVVDVKLK